MTTRVPPLVVGVILVLTACSLGGDDVRDQLRELDPDITDEMADCIIAELDSRGVGLTESDEQDATISQAGEEALVMCLTDEPESPDPSDPATVDQYGSDPTLDELWDGCEAGDGAACDDLYFRSPINSEYEAFGETCGHRVPTPPALCVEALAPPESSDQ